MPVPWEWGSSSHIYFQMQPAAERTQRSLTTPPVATQLLSVLRGTWVQSTSINVKYYLPLYSVLLSIFRRETAGLFFFFSGGWRGGVGWGGSQRPAILVICSPLKHLFIFIPHSSPCQAFLWMKYTHTSTRALSRHLSVFCWCPFVAHFDKWTRTGHFRRAGLWLSRTGFQTETVRNERLSPSVYFDGIYTNEEILASAFVMHIVTVRFKRKNNSHLQKVAPCHSCSASVT